jgi:hypothetical protein
VQAALAAAFPELSHLHHIGRAELAKRAQKDPGTYVILENILNRKFKPKVLDRYPPTEDRPGYPFPGNVLSSFCFP